MLLLQSTVDLVWVSTFRSHIGNTVVYRSMHIQIQIQQWIIFKLPNNIRSIVPVPLVNYTNVLHANLFSMCVKHIFASVELFETWFSKRSCDKLYFFFFYTLFFGKGSIKVCMILVNTFEVFLYGHWQCVSFTRCKWGNKSLIHSNLKTNTLKGFIIQRKRTFTFLFEMLTFNL